jgi:hypothetical protein
MKITTAAFVTVLALCGPSGAAQAREDDEGAEGAAKADAGVGSAATEPEVNYGTRARVRTIHPDGGYSIRNEYWGHGNSGEGDVDREMTDD